MEEKDHITCCYDHGSASSGDLKRVVDFYNPGESMGRGTRMAILEMLITVWVISKKL